MTPRTTRLIRGGLLAGMAVGPRFVDDADGAYVGRDDVYWLITARFDLIRFQVRPSSDGAELKKPSGGASAPNQGTGAAPVFASAATKYSTATSRGPSLEGTYRRSSGVSGLTARSAASPGLR